MIITLLSDLQNLGTKPKKRLQRYTLFCKDAFQIVNFFDKIMYFFTILHIIVQFSAL